MACSARQLVASDGRVPEKGDHGGELGVEVRSEALGVVERRPRRGPDALGTIGVWRGAKRG